MSSHDSFAASGNSPTRKKKTAIPQADFTVENHGSICLLRPLNDAACDWVQAHIGADNGYQPYYTTVIVEPRFLNQIITSIRREGLVVR
jgi:hypothetical protein